jgi:hypothetical protein
MGSDVACPHAGGANTGGSSFASVEVTSGLAVVDLVGLPSNTRSSSEGPRASSAVLIQMLTLIQHEKRTGMRR